MLRAVPRSANTLAPQQTGACTDWYDGGSGEYITTTGDCTGGGGEDPGGPVGPGANGGGGYSGGFGGVGGGSGGGGSPGSYTAVATIVPNAAPCENNIINSVLSLSGDDITALFAVLGSSTRITWTITSGITNPLPNNTIPNASTFTNLGNPSDVRTVLSTAYTGRATNIAVARTIIHESIHAYLEKWGALNNISPNTTIDQLLEVYVNSIEFTQVEQHQLMSRIVSQMASTLQNYSAANGILIGHDRAENLFWVGLSTSSYYQDLPANRKIQITLDNQAEEYNSRFELPTDSTIYSQKQGAKACP